MLMSVGFIGRVSNFKEDFNNVKGTTRPQARGARVALAPHPPPLPPRTKMVQQTDFYLQMIFDKFVQKTKQNTRVFCLLYAK